MSTLGSIGVAAGCAALLVSAAWLVRREQRWMRGVRLQNETMFLELRAAASASQSSLVRSPISVAPGDLEISPFTGLGRAQWQQVAERILEGVLQHSDELRGPIRLPNSALAGYPRLGPDGRVVGERESYMESVCRTLWVAAPVLVNAPQLRIAGREVGDYFREYIVRGTSSVDESGFGMGRTDRPSQHSVEAASLCITLMLAPNALWNPLTSVEKDRVLDWLEACSHLPVHDNNWRWFNIIVRSFLKLHGRRADDTSVRGHLDAIERMYADAGWFRDGRRFDFYSAWAMQFYPLFWASWDGDSFPSYRDRFYERNDRFLESYPHIFSRRGEMPAWGRSLIYRFAAAAPFPAAFLRPTSPVVDPGFARRLSSGCMQQFLHHPGFLKRGIPSLGFQGEQGHLVDGYSGVASPLWCAKIFVALTLPASSPFWSRTENEGFWTDPPAEVAFGSTGLRVTHDAKSGHTRLFAPTSERTSDPRYTAPFFDTADAVDSHARR